MPNAVTYRFHAFCISSCNLTPPNRQILLQHTLFMDSNFISTLNSFRHEISFRRHNLLKNNFHGICHILFRKCFLFIFHVCFSKHSDRQRYFMRSFDDFDAPTFPIRCLPCNRCMNNAQAIFFENYFIGTITKSMFTIVGLVGIIEVAVKYRFMQFGHNVVLNMFCSSYWRRTCGIYFFCSHR